MTEADSQPTTAIEVFDADLFRVTQGTNEGDALEAAHLALAGDVYALTQLAQVRHLTLNLQTGSAEGAHVIAGYRMMTATGGARRIILLETAQGQRLIWPDGPISSHERYTLIAVEQNLRIAPTGELLAAFAAGTTIIRADGRIAAIETLSPGDMLLTRDHGPQPLRYIFRATLDARGDAAPIVITPGALGNLGDLVVAPSHRIFTFPHPAEDSVAGITGSRRGVLIEARHLVDGKTIRRHSGGRFDFYALVFDAHEVIYAEGLPCESHLVTEAGLRRMPRAMARELKSRFPQMAHRPHYAVDPG